MPFCRYVIFDEVHNIESEFDGGAAWEQNILLVRCPFLALSATVANPEELRDWFQDVENLKKDQDASKNGASSLERSYKVFGTCSFLKFFCID